MTTSTAPLTLALLLAAAPACAADALPPVRAQVVDDATLAGISGKYLGADMLVGVRVALVSQVQTAQGGTAQAQGVLQVTRRAGGFDVAVDTRAGAQAGQGDAAVTSASAQGADGLRIAGIGQITQIAGHGNRLGNLATIEVLDPATAASASTAGFNGQLQAGSDAGGMRADVRFDGVGLRVALDGPGVALGQHVRGDGILQHGRIAGDGVSGANQLHLQLLGGPAPVHGAPLLGVQHALSALRMLPR